MSLKILNCANKKLLTPCHSKKSYSNYDDECYEDPDCQTDCHKKCKKWCKGRGNKIPLFSPAAQYQRLKIIQNTVRVPSSLYSMNIGALTVFERPINGATVNWNQMSDRAVPHKQTAKYSMSSSVSVRPGNMSPGGVGCDIKHNSYDRYLARLKGSRSLRKEKLPENYGVENIPFSYIMPVYGGKVVKTSIGTNTCELN